MTAAQDAPFPRAEIERGMRRAVATQCFGVPLYQCLTAGGMATLYAQCFGAGDFMVGLVNGMLQLGLIAVIFVPPLVERYNKQAVFIGSLVLAIPAALPLIALPQIARVTSNAVALWIMAAVALAYSVSTAGFSGAWFPALLDFLPLGETGRFFGRLRTAWQCVNIAIYLAASLLMTGDGQVVRMQILFAVLIFGVVLRLMMVTGLPQRPIRAPAKASLLARLRMMYADIAFRRFVLFSIAANAALVWTYPTLIVFARHLGFPPRRIMIAILVRMSAGAISYSIWGRMTDRSGPGRAYRIGLYLLAAGFAVWAILPAVLIHLGSSAAAFAGLLLALLLYGLAEAAIHLGLTRHSFQLTPHERAPTYLGLQPSFIAAVCGGGQLLAGLALALFDAAAYTGWFSPYLVGILLSACGALALTAAIRRLPGHDVVR